MRIGSIETELRFTAIRLWEHADRIRNGELPELAPLLYLCEETPTIETIREEVTLIRTSQLSEGTQAELVGIALLAALRRFSREHLLPLFRENITMIQGLDVLEEVLRETGKIAEWEARGEARGEALGKIEGARETLLYLGRKRFGEPPTEVMQALEAIHEVKALQELTERLLAVKSWEEVIAKP